MKKRLLKGVLALLAGAWALGSYAQTTGDIFTYGGHKYKVTGKNLITNGSFEDGFTGWTSANNFSSELSSSYFTLKTNGAQKGDQYLVGTVNAGATGLASIGTAWPIESGKTYVYSYWIKSETGKTETNYIKSALTNNPGTETQELGIPTLTSDGSWCQFQTVFENTDGYAYCQAQFRWLNNQWGFDNFVLAEIQEMPNTEALEVAIAEAENVYSETGEEAAALQAAITSAKGLLTSESVKEVNQATADLNAAILSYKLANATVNNPLDVTAYMTSADCSSKTGWTTSGTVNTNNGQHWSGDASNVYLEPCNWGATSWTSTMQQTLNVPDGKYKLIAAGRASLSATIKMTLSDASYTFASVEDKGGTIATDGTKWESVATGIDAGKSFANNNEGYGWSYGSVETVIAGAPLVIGVEASASTQHQWASIDDFKLLYLGYDNSAAIAALQELIAQAEEQSEANGAPGALLDILDSKIKAAYVALQTATKTVLETATAELKAAMAAVEEVEGPFAALKAAYTYNSKVLDNSTAVSGDAYDTYYEAITAAQIAIWGGAETVEDVNAAIAALEAARRAYILGGSYPYVEDGTEVADVPFDLSFVMNDPAVTSATAWTNGRTASGEAYDGAPDNTYLDITWNQNLDIYQTVTGLPDGIYSLTVATRASESHPDAYVYVKDVEQTKSAATEIAGSTGNTLGRGWGWTTISTIKVYGGELTIGFRANCTSGNGQWWAGADNFQLFLQRALTQEEIEAIEMTRLDAAKERLTAQIEAAEALDMETNVGTDAFMKSQDQADYISYILPIAKQQLSQDLGSTSVELINSMTTQLERAINDFNTLLNEPALNEAFVIVMSEEGFTYDNKAVNFQNKGNEASGGYTIGFYAEENPSYAQTVYFTPADNDVANSYYVNIVDASGEKVYLCNGSVYGGNTSQIRMTTDVTKALAVTVKPVDIAQRQYNLYNPTADLNIGSNGDQGFFSSNNHATLQLRAAAKANVTLTIGEAGFATLMLPFGAEIPEGVTAYACEAAEEANTDGIRVLTLTPATTIEANTPYIVEGAGEYAFSGYGTAYQDEYTAGWLTGTLAGKTATAGTYVLQNQENVVGFYPVVGDSEPTIGANRAWLVPEETESDVKAFVLGGLLTGIENTVAVADDTLVDVYTLNGVTVRRSVKLSEALKGLNKGVYIVNGVKKAVK